MALPPLTPEQRAAALEKAAIARRERAAVKNRLKHSGASLIEVLKEGSREGGNEIVGKMKVASVLESLPGVGKVKARKLMEQLAHTLPVPEPKEKERSLFEKLKDVMS